MAKFSVQGWAAENIYAISGLSPEAASETSKMAVSLSSGIIAGVASAIISHPADTLLSLVNKEGAGGNGTIVRRLMNLAVETGFVKLCVTGKCGSMQTLIVISLIIGLGLGARCVMIGTLTAGQFGIFDIVMKATGAKKFHFTDPNKA